MFLVDDSLLEGVDEAAELSEVEGVAEEPPLLQGLAALLGWEEETLFL